MYNIPPAAQKLSELKNLILGAIQIICSDAPGTMDIPPLNIRKSVADIREKGK